MESAGVSGSGTANLAVSNEVSAAALRHSKSVLATLFGSPAQRHFDVRYWDGSIERGKPPASGFALVLTRPGALRRMLLPPSELSIVEAYLSGDVDVDGDLSLAVTIGDDDQRAAAIAARARVGDARSPRAAEQRRTMSTTCVAFALIGKWRRAGDRTSRNAIVRPFNTTTTSATTSTSSGSTSAWCIRARTSSRRT